MRKTFTALFVVLLAAAVGCGGGTSGTGGFTTGLERERTIETLTPSEIAGTCAKFSSRARETFSNDLVCPGLAAIGASAYPENEQVQACNEIETVCREDSNEDGGLQTCRLTNAVSGCRITVETLDRCLADFFDETENSLGRLSCGSEPDQEALDNASYILFKGFPRSESCELLSQQCPDFLDKLRED